MPTSKPSVIKVWQERAHPERQPTCHDVRNPAAPWLALNQDSDEAIEDRQFARAWAVTRSSQTLASLINPDEGIGTKPRKPRFDSITIIDGPVLNGPATLVPFIQQVDQAVQALELQSKQKLLRQKGHHGSD